jgi:hypothetical protein
MLHTDNFQFTRFHLMFVTEEYVYKSNETLNNVF